MDTRRGRGGRRTVFVSLGPAQVVGKEQEELQVTDGSITAPSPSYLNGDRPLGLEHRWFQGGTIPNPSP